MLESSLSSGTQDPPASHNRAYISQCSGTFISRCDAPYIPLQALLTWEFLVTVVLWNLLFSTSAGAQTVVATVPAIKEESACDGTPSAKDVLARSCAFAFSYLDKVAWLVSIMVGSTLIVTYTAIWETFMSTDLVIVGAKPFKKARPPSSRKILKNSVILFEYLDCSADGLTPSVHILTRIT
jgi:hypothetical protein